MARPNPLLYNEAAELSLIGSILVEKTAWSQVDIVDAECFANAGCRAIWDFFATKKGHTTTEELVTHLAKIGGDAGSLLSEFGGRAAIEKLYTLGKPVQEIEGLARVIQECSANRQTKRVLDHGIGSFQPSDEPLDPTTRIDTIVKDLAKIQVGRRFDMSELEIGALQWEKDLQWRIKNPGKLSGMRMHFRDIDDSIIGGLEPGNFWVIASNTGEGKSIFVGEIALRLATKPQDNDSIVKVGMFGVEMSGQEIYGRFIQSAARVENKQLRYPNRLTDVEKRRILAAREILKGQVMPNLKYMGPSKFSALDDIIRQSKYLVKEMGVGLIIVDYLQRISTKHRDNRTDEIGDVTSRLKGLAADLNIPIIAVSQVTRESGKNGGRATMFDMADSANIERDADYVTTLWRPSKHLEGKAQTTFKNVAVVDLVKGRFRENSTCFLRFDGNMARFDDLAESEIFVLSEAAKNGMLKTTPRGTTKTR